MILLLIVGTFLGEYESSYVKKHEEQFSQQEYQWIMAIGTCVIATAMIMFFSSSIDRSVLWDMRVVLGTCIMTCLTILFIRLNIRLTQTAERSFSSQFSVLAIPLMMLADSIL